MKKELVSKEVAKAIEYRRSIKGGSYTFKNFMEVKTARFDFGNEAKALNEISIETLASALLNGYEVERTKEELLHDYYSSRETTLAQSDAIEMTLKILGITVDGIND